MAKNNALIVVVIVIAAALLGVLGYAALNKDNNGTNQQTTTQLEDADHIETSAFRINAPDKAINTSPLADDTGTIRLEAFRSYGTIKIEIYTSSLPVNSQEETGTVTSDMVTVAGVQAERKDIDYVLSINGPTDESVVRYEIRFDRINKPSEETYTKVAITLLSKDDVQNSDLDQFKQEAQAIIDSLVIK